MSTEVQTKTIDLYEAPDGGLHLHQQDDALVYDLLIWRNGGFQQDAEDLSEGTSVSEATHPYEANELASMQHAATWYGPGVFVVYPRPDEIGRNAERYIGSWLIHAPGLGTESDKYL